MLHRLYGHSEETDYVKTNRNSGSAFGSLYAKSAF